MIFPSGSFRVPFPIADADLLLHTAGSARRLPYGDALLGIVRAPLELGLLEVRSLELLTNY